jgi:transcription antitermination factor NusA-like protein
MNSINKLKKENVKIIKDNQDHKRFITIIFIVSSI